MPIYTYECPTHGEYEKYVGSWREKKELDNCPVVMQDATICSMVSCATVYLVAVQPDNYWSGKYNEAIGEYVTSKSRFNRILKDRKLAVVEPGMKLGLSNEERIERIQQRSEKAKEQAIAEVVAKI